VTIPSDRHALAAAPDHGSMHGSLVAADAPVKRRHGSRRARPETVKVGLCGLTMGAAAYFESFGVVEVQPPFNDPAAAATLERWRADAPPGFEFVMKAWQVITHGRPEGTKGPTESPENQNGAFRLNDAVMSAWKTTLGCALHLRAGAILFQCPAGFRPTEENAAAMRRFFEAIDRPAATRLLWEPRGPWPDALISSLCRELGLIHVVDPFIRPSVTPRPVYWRLGGSGGRRTSYSDSHLLQLKEWLPTQGDAYVMFANVPGADDARRFLQHS
jgi:uncharacterized protein YecE (DUF72 family)